MPDDSTSEDVLLNDLRVRVQAYGEGPPVVLLHGFPDCRHTWKRQIAPLVRAGYRVFTPDLRGFDASEKPHGVAAYGIEHLVADVAALHEHAGGEPIRLVGHDWGGIIAWYVAMQRPDILERVVVLNAPHPATYRRELLRSRQWLASWYIAFFQIPILPEALLGLGGARAVERALERASRGERGPDRDNLRLIRRAAAEPGALRAGINYYRAAVRSWIGRSAMHELRRIDIPTLVIWGLQDPFLVASLIDGLEDWVGDLRVERMPEAGHFVHWDEPERTATALLAFLGGN